MLTTDCINVIVECQVPVECLSFIEQTDTALYIQLHLTARHYMFETTFRNLDDTLRKDAGCSSELDYIEQTSWVLFLKYF
jgi:hypothetical protein